MKKPKPHKLTKPKFVPVVSACVLWFGVIVNSLMCGGGLTSKGLSHTACGCLISVSGVCWGDSKD